MAKENNGAPGNDGVTFEAIEESGVESFLQQVRTNGSATRIDPCQSGRRRFRKTGERKCEFSPYLRSGIAWSREPSSSFWSRFSKLTSNRGRTDTDRSERHMKRSSEWTRGSWKTKTKIIDLDCEPTWIHLHTAPMVDRRGRLEDLLL